MKMNIGVYVSIFFILFSSVIIGQSLSLDYYGEYGPGPGLLPLWSGGIIFILSIISLVGELRKRKGSLSDILPTGKARGDTIATLISLVMFLLIVEFTGFIIASILLLFILFLRGYKWCWALGLSTVTTLILYAIFGVILLIPLPVNIFGW